MAYTETEDTSNVVTNGRSVSDLQNDSIKIDKKANDSDNKYQWKIVWINVVLLAFLHGYAVYGYLNRYQADYKTVIWSKFIGLSSSIGITAGAHRLWSHRSYEANWILQVILMCMVTMTYQNSIYIWCRDHRVHHKFSETDADPHNAKRGFFFSHVGWLLIRKHKDVIEKGKTVDMSDLEANPIVMFQHKYYYFLVVLGTFVMPTFVPWYFWNESLYFSFVATCTTYVVSVNLVWCINSLAHLYGDKPYDQSIGPVESYAMKFFGLGEGFHNYHHTFPQDYRASEYGFEGRNVTTGFIDFFAWLGLVKNRKTVKDNIIVQRANRTGDGTYKKPKINHLQSALIFVLFIALI